MDAYIRQYVRMQRKKVLDDIKYYRKHGQYWNVYAMQKHLARMRGYDLPKHDVEELPDPY